MANRQRGAGLDRPHQKIGDKQHHNCVMEGYSLSNSSLERTSPGS